MSHLSQEQLEAPGEANAAHLRECAECRKAVARAAGRRKLLGGMTPYTLADVGFSRVEAKLMEHVRENPPGPRWTLGRIFAIGALAAVFVMFAISTVRPLLGNKPAEEPVLSAKFEPMTVIHASGAVKVKAGDVLGRDAAVEAEAGRVVVATADGTSLRIGAGGKFVLGMGNHTAVLMNGTMSVDAQRGGPWVFHAVTRWLKAEDASFDVAADSLKVYRGSVLVSDDPSFRSARRINAPTAVVLHSGAESTLTGAPSHGALQKTAAAPWARFELALQASEVELDGQSVGGAPLSLMTGIGKHHVRARIGDQWREADFDLSSGGVGLVDLPEKTTVSPVPAVAGPVVEADPAAIAAAVKAQLPKLRVCHEKWLKVNESARGKVMMTLTVSPKGKVTRSSFAAAEDVPATVNECLGRAVRTLKLPTSSEEVELEIPVLLGAQ